jgi:hypothetical protein
VAAIVWFIVLEAHSSGWAWAAVALVLIGLPLISARR